MDKKPIGLYTRGIDDFRTQCEDSNVPFVSAAVVPRDICTGLNYLSLRMVIPLIGTNALSRGPRKSAPGSSARECRFPVPELVSSTSGNEH